MAKLLVLLLVVYLLLCLPGILGKKVLRERVLLGLALSLPLLVALGAILILRL